MRENKHLVPTVFIDCDPIRGIRIVGQGIQVVEAPLQTSETQSRFFKMRRLIKKSWGAALSTYEFGPWDQPKRKG